MPEINLVYLKGNFIKLWIIIFLIFLPLYFPGNVLFCQEDTLQTEKKIDPAKLDSAYHSPRKAALLSGVLPGLGQVYNKRVWKVPIIYGGFVALGYLIKRNAKEYNLWRQAYIDYPDYKLNVSYQLTKEQIERGKNFYKRQKELSIIGTAGFYLLQIIDATVDAYLFDWSVGDDLSLKIEPATIQAPAGIYMSFDNTFGLRACLSF